MEVPDPVLLNLKCENCKCYLSCGPVLVLDDERSRCGRCPKPEGGAKRMKPYEELAKFVAFPCRYKKNGCKEKIRFEENKEHEENCAYKVYSCPIGQSGKCNWSGKPGGLLEHCKLKHPDNVIENPVKLKQDITKSSLGNYVLFAFQMLFLVQTKVCTVSKKLYYSVRLFGDPKLACKYTYDIDFTNENDKIIKRGKVQPEGCLALQVDNSVALDIGGLLAVLGDFKDIIFSLTVRSTDGEAEKVVTGLKNNNDDSTTTMKSKTSKIQVTCQQAAGNEAENVVTEEKKKSKKKKNKKPTTTRPGNNTVHVKCEQCKSMTIPVYSNEEGWVCAACGPDKGHCKNTTKGCIFSEYSEKCVTHESYYCPYSTRCELCKKNIRGMRLEEHYEQAHNNSTCILPQKWNEKFILKSNIGYLICEYANLDILFIMSPLSNEQLHLYKCVVEIKNLQTGKVYTCVTGEACYNFWFDWCLQIPNKFPTLNLESKCAIKIDIIKEENM